MINSFKNNIKTLYIREDCVNHMNSIDKIDTSKMNKVVRSYMVKDTDKEQSSGIKKLLRSIGMFEEFVPVFTIYGVIGNNFPEEYEEYGIVSNMDTIIANLLEFKDSSYNKCIIVVDSPGGYAMPEQLDIINIMDSIKASGKEIIVYVTGMCCSLAYFISSHASSIISKNMLCEIGSLGTCTTMVDFSKMYENIGIKVINVSSGGIKGDWAEGLPISEGYRNQIQYSIDKNTEIFKKVVNSGRNVNFDSYFTGEYWMADDALAVNLIDDIKNLDNIRVVNIPFDDNEDDDNEEEDDNYMKIIKEDISMIMEENTQVVENNEVIEYNDNILEQLEVISEENNEIENISSGQIEENIDSNELKLKELEEKYNILYNEMEEMKKIKMYNDPISKEGGSLIIEDFDKKVKKYASNHNIGYTDALKTLVALYPNEYTAWKNSLKTNR